MENIGNLKRLHSVKIFILKGVGFLAIQSTSNQETKFRIAATGTVLESDQSAHVVKKLKLVGYPEKIFKNTCFVKV